VNTTLEAEKQIAFARQTGIPDEPPGHENLPPDLKKLALTDEQVASFGRSSATSTTWRCSPTATDPRSLEQGSARQLGAPGRARPEAMAKTILELQGVVKRYGATLGVGRRRRRA
jgi:hypothetical protein